MEMIAFSIKGNIDSVRKGKTALKGMSLNLRGDEEVKCENWGGFNSCYKCLCSELKISQW